MKILPVQIFQMHKSQKNVPKVESQPNLRALNFDVVAFKGIDAEKKALRALAKYGLKDAYTEEDMLHSDILESMLRSGFFKKSISQIVQVMNKKRSFLTETAIEFLDEIERLAKKNPNISLRDANKLLGKKYEKSLTDIQQGVFEKLIQMASKMPLKLQAEFSELIQEKDLRMSRKSVIRPFSAKTFIYQLENFAKQVESKNNKNEIYAIRLIIKNAKNIFKEELIESKKASHKKLSKEDKLRLQRLPENLQKNTMKYDVLYSLFSISVLRRNKELDRIFKNASAMMHGYKVMMPFKRKEFLHDLGKITSKLKYKTLASKITEIAHELPQSCDNIAAFVVKHLDSNDNRIGYYWLKDSLVSIDHMKATNIGGKNRPFNMILCRSITNRRKTDDKFDDWCRKHPETYVHLPNHVKQLKELQARGVYKKVGLYEDYTGDVSKTIEELSPKEKPIKFN